MTTVTACHAKYRIHNMSLAKLGRTNGKVCIGGKFFPKMRLSAQIS
jgi:hypothetical protein